MGSRRDPKFSLRVLLCELLKERGLKEGVQTPRRASPIAIVEVEAAAWENECTDAIASGGDGLDTGYRHRDGCVDG